MTDTPRLIEHAFPLKQASLDSVHEKNVRHGHISTLHIWPARRPLAACRAALIATLLPDPSAEPKPEGMSDEEWQKEIVRRRQELCEKIGGKVVKKIEKKRMPSGQVVEREKEVTEGGILHWGRETENKDDLEWFRQEIRKAYGGRAPKVLDPFAGGGAIPLEAMRLGCEATAIDINPVAWFILKCTLEYPQKLAGKTWPLPEFILRDEAFMREFLAKAKGFTKGQIAKALERLGRTPKPGDQGALDLEAGGPLDTNADLAWHVRAWGQWVLDRARRELAEYYPTYAEFEPLDLKNPKPHEKQPMRLVPLHEDGTPNVEALNAELGEAYLKEKRNPRWVAEPTVAYLWARTVTCKNCRATIPLLKTRWLCKKDKKRVLLSINVVGQASLPATPLPATPLPATPLPATPPATPPPATERQAQRPAPPGKDAFSIYRRRLPHWRLEGATYFLTWRLHDTQPELGPDERGLVVSALRHFEGTRYKLHAFVVMDDHAHVLVEPLIGHDLTAIAHSWKSYTANQLQRRFGRQGAVWQDESFDRIVRDETEFLEKAQYIQNNPFKRWPELTEYEWVGFPQWEGTGIGAAGTGGEGIGAAGTGGEGTGAAGTEACPTSLGVVFGIESKVPIRGGNAAQRRENDKRLGAGTMSRSGAKCPCCPAIMTMEDIRLEGRAGRLGAVNTAVVVDGQDGKEYRVPTDHEIKMAEKASEALLGVFAQVPFGIPDEPLPSKEALGFRVPLYGFDKWSKLFTSRQLLAIGTLIVGTRASAKGLQDHGYHAQWAEAIRAFLSCGIDRLVDRSSTICRPDPTPTQSGVINTFSRFALPITWDFIEGVTIERASGGFQHSLEWVAEYADNVASFIDCQSPVLGQESVLALSINDVDVVITDPPYYDAIPYSDLMDFFYVWLKRTLKGTSHEIDQAFEERLSPKWDHQGSDGELIDDASRHNGDTVRSRAIYEEGMFRAFQACHRSLGNNGRMVVVFAHKKPDAWEALASGIMRAGFVVDGSWPIQTEMGNRTRALSSAALSSSVWLVCKKRPEDARPGWDNGVLQEMRENIREKLREFWDAGIRGPDFVWAATGPAMEAYSKHPVVKKANDPGQVMTVSEFLMHVRRMVVDYVVGRVLSGDGDSGAQEAATDRLDEPTAYYLLHRHDFGLDEAPAGACILYAVSCGISDKELASTWDLIAFTKGKEATEDTEGTEDEDSEISVDSVADSDSEEESGSKVKLKTWAQRKGRSLGYEAPGGRPVPLIDRIHCLMHLWRAGDVHKVDDYLDENALRRHELFKRLLQSLIELSPRGSEERSLLESISNHVGGKGVVKEELQIPMGYESGAK